MHEEADLEMPPIGKGDRLTDEEITSLREWINAGARWPSSETDTTIQFSAKPTFRAFWLEGNERRFSEQTGMKDGLVGGYLSSRSASPSMLTRRCVSTVTRLRNRTIWRFA